MLCVPSVILCTSTLSALEAEMDHCFSRIAQNVK